MMCFIAGRQDAMEEHRVAAQEQVATLTWKLQAFEQQYAALYQQYAKTMKADGSDRVSILRHWRG